MTDQDQMPDDMPSDAPRFRSLGSGYEAVISFLGVVSVIAAVYYMFNLGSGPELAVTLDLILVQFRFFTFDLPPLYTPLETEYFFIVIGLMVPFTYLIYPAVPGAHSDRVPWYDWVLAAASAGLCIWMALHAREALNLAWTYVAPLHAQWLALLFGVMMLEAARRTGGNVLAILIAIFGTYPIWASFAPPPLDAITTPPLATAAFQVYSAEGLVGIPLKAFAGLVVGYLIFGAALQVTGAGKFFLEVAFAIMGHVRGGPAKVAILSSGLMGSVSGSVITNIITTGTMTIPAMKRVGFRASYAGGVEACASTGGVLMPPVMGATAFVMAVNIERPYAEIVIAALIPSILYYLGLFIQIDAYAARYGLKGLPREELPSLWDAVKRGWYHLFAFVYLLYLLLYWRLESTAPFFATFALIVVHQLYHLATDRSGVWGFRDYAAFFAAVYRLFVELVGLLVGIGLIIGGVTLTGKIGSFAHELISVAGDSVLLLLAMGAITSFILGMGMTITAAYIFLAVTLAPALEQAGLNRLAVHLFVLYWGMLSFITPPVAIGSFAAASVASAPPMKTGLESMRLGTIIYFIPFFFALNPTLILQNPDPIATLTVLASAGVGILFVSAGLQGYLIFVGDIMKTGMFRWPLRALLLIGGLCLASPGGDYIGVSNAQMGMIAAILLIPAIAIAWWLNSQAPRGLDPVPASD